MKRQNVTKRQKDCVWIKYIIITWYQRRNKQKKEKEDMYVYIILQGEREQSSSRNNLSLNTENQGRKWSEKSFGKQERKESENKLKVEIKLHERDR